MTPTPCLVKHDPANGKYGDCLRACIATILDLESETIPNFAEQPHDTWLSRLRTWLETQGLAPIMFVTDNDPRSTMQEMNPTAPYILFAGTAEGDHCVVCIGDKVEWNPSWYPTPIIGPLSNGLWQILVLGRV